MSAPDPPRVPPGAPDTMGRDETRRRYFETRDTFLKEVRDTTAREIVEADRMATVAVRWIVAGVALAVVGCVAIPIGALWWWALNGMSEPVATAWTMTGVVLAVSSIVPIAVGWAMVDKAARKVGV